MPHQICAMTVVEAFTPFFLVQTASHPHRHRARTGAEGAYCIRPPLRHTYPTWNRTGLDLRFTVVRPLIIGGSRSERMDSMREVFDIVVPWITDISTRRVPCLLCGRRDITPLNTFLLNGQRFYTVRCQADGMMWLDPQPTKPFYRRLYEDHYHTADGEDPLFDQGTLDVHSNEKSLRQTAALRLDEIEGFVPHGRFLEVGFGSGHALQEVRRRGWDVFGIELARTCVDAMRAEGIPAIRAEPPSYDGPDEAFDVIGMYSVIEHTHHPDAYLRRARALLKPGGVLVLRLPDTSAQGPPASLLAHLYHFNSATIIELLRRCHFEVLQVGAFGLWRPTRYLGDLWNMNVVSRRTESTP